LPLYVPAGELEAQIVPRQRIMRYFHVLSWRMMAGDTDLDAGMRERNKDIQVRLQRLTSTEVRENMATSGTSEHCMERIRWLQHEFHLSEVICWFNPGGLRPHQTELGSRSRFAAHIMPNFQ
jgi:hypothetical protein